MSIYKVRVSRLFDRLDTNRDGVLSPDDLRPTANGPSPAQVLVTGFLKAGDSNTDGRMTRDELLSHVDRAITGRSVGTLPPYLHDFADTVFRGMDTDGNGKVGKDEFAQYLKSGNVIDPGATDEFAHLDRDGDGSLTLDDLRAATHHFFTALNDVPQHWLHAAVSA